MIKLKLTNINEIMKAVRQNTEDNKQRMINKMFELGYKAIVEARDNADFLNHSNNLRSSLGIAVALNGRIVKSDFEIRLGGKDGDGQQGLEHAKELISKTATEYPNTIVLILVAGEKYAFFVENKGKLVLTNFTFDIEDSLISFVK